MTGWDPGFDWASSSRLSAEAFARPANPVGTDLAMARPSIAGSVPFRQGGARRRTRSSRFPAMLCLLHSDQKRSRDPQAREQGKDRQRHRSSHIAARCQKVAALVEIGDIKGEAGTRRECSQQADCKEPS